MTLAQDCSLFFCAIDEAAAMTHQQQLQLLLTGTSTSWEDTNRLLTSTTIVISTNINFSLYILRLRLLMQILLSDTHQLVTFLNGLFENLESFRHNIRGFVTQQPALNGAVTGVLICKWVVATSCSRDRSRSCMGLEVVQLILVKPHYGVKLGASSIHDIFE